jgi:hypothetical protein
MKWTVANRNLSDDRKLRGERGLYLFVRTVDILRPHFFQLNCTFAIVVGQQF